MLNLDTKVKGIRGDIMRLSYPSEKDLASLPKRDDGKPDERHLPDDTYRNVIINCLALYSTKDKREVLWVSALANEILSAGETVDLSDKHKKFLIDVLYDQTFKEDDKKYKTGIYMSWVTAQILRDLGVEQSD